MKKEKLAEICYEASKHLIEDIDKSKTWNDLSEIHKEEFLSLVIVLLNNSYEYIHNNWYTIISNDDWKHGDKFDSTEKTHPFCKKFDDLDENQKNYYRVINSIVQTVNK